MNIDPLVSVIMPAYNASETIVESVNSILSQEYSNWELIVIDDGSTDDTYQKVCSIKDTRIIIYQETNKGVAATRNQGIKAAKGKYISFLDSDDLWNKEKLKIQVNYFETNENQFGLVHTAYKEFDKKSEYYPKPLKQLAGLKIEGEIYEDLLVHDFIATLTVMVRKDVFKDIGYFDVTLSGPEDWDLWIRISRIFNIGYIDIPLAMYRLNPSGLSKNIFKFEDQLWKVMEKHLLQSNLSSQKKRLGLWLFFRHMSHSYAKVDQPIQAVNRLLKAIKAKPFCYKNFQSIVYLVFFRVQNLVNRKR